MSDGLPLDAAFALSPGGRASPGFCAPLNVGPDGGVLGAGRGWDKVALAGGKAVAADAASGSVFAVVTLRSAFDPATAGSTLSDRRDGIGATGDEAGGLPGPPMGAVSVARTGDPRFGETLAGTIGGGIVARGCAGGGSA